MLLEDLKVSSSPLAPEIHAFYLLSGILQVKIRMEIPSVPLLLKTHQWLLIVLRTDTSNVAVSFSILCLSCFSSNPSSCPGCPLPLDLCTFCSLSLECSSLPSCLLPTGHSSPSCRPQLTFTIREASHSFPPRCSWYPELELVSVVVLWRVDYVSISHWA